MTVRNLVNHFLSNRQQKVERAELTRRSFEDYRRSCGRVIGCFGRQRKVEDLGPVDFERLKNQLGKTLGVVSLGNEINRIRVLFHAEHLTDHHLAEAGGDRLDTVHLQPRHGQLLDQGIPIKLGIHPFTQPIFAEFHRRA